MKSNSKKEEIKGQKKPNDIIEKQETSECPHKSAINTSRLEEVRFWVTIIKEHALFIRLALPCDRTRLIARAKALYERFQALEAKLKTVRKIDSELREEIIQAVIAIIEYQNLVLRLMLECELRANEFPLLIDHITRESVYFLEYLKYPQAENPLTALLQLEVFWLRIMKDHADVILHLLDPSERTLIAQAQQFKVTFTNLLETARDFKSMNRSGPKCFNTVIRFTKEVIENTAAFRDFKAQAYELIILCKLLSAVPTPLLLNHVTREAEKFLEDIEELLPLVPKCNCNDEGKN